MGDIKDKIKSAPSTPGCYIYKDDKDQVIYVGKSKFLPKRVASYFSKNHGDYKTKVLVENIKDIEYRSTATESDALILEEELIKLYKPKFNIKCKDDKSRKVSICFTELPFQKLEIVRSKTDDRPSFDFTNGMVCSEVFDLLHDIFPLRSCSYNLTSENIESGKFKSCLEHQLGRCNAPCVGLQTGFEYLRNVFMVKKLFDFNFSEVKKFLHREMFGFSEKMEFEKANDYLHRIQGLDKLEELVEPLRVNKYNQQATNLKNILGLKKLPVIIEAFDNSHNQGDCNVAASVRYINEKPNKSDYRKYIIKEGNMGDDCASFEEVVFRRFKRVLDEKGKLPDLVLIDGGTGQLNVAIKVFKDLGLTDKVDLISISKDDNHRSSVIHTTDGMRHKMEFPVLGIIQEEVHRFAIKFHREKSVKKLLAGKK